MIVDGCGQQSPNENKAQADQVGEGPTASCLRQFESRQQLDAKL